jgi:hypothetical protein
MIEAAAVQKAWFISMGVMLGLFVVHAAGHLRFVFILTRRADLTLICLHFATFVLYTAATLVCVMIYWKMIHDGRVAEAQLRQELAEARAGRSHSPINRNSRIFAFVFTGIPGYQDVLRIGLEILAMGSMFLSRDMLMMHDVKWIDACSLISGGIAFFLLLVVVEIPFLLTGYFCRQEIQRQQKMRNHAHMNFIAK